MSATPRAISASTGQDGSAPAGRASCFSEPSTASVSARRVRPPNGPDRCCAAVLGPVLGVLGMVLAPSGREREKRKRPGSSVATSLAKKPGHRSALIVSVVVVPPRSPASVVCRMGDLGVWLVGDELAEGVGVDGVAGQGDDGVSGDADGGVPGFVHGGPTSLGWGGVGWRGGSCLRWRLRCGCSGRVRVRVLGLRWVRLVWRRRGGRGPTAVWG